MDKHTAAASVWPDWFRLSLGGRPTRVAHLVPAGLDVVFCDLPLVGQAPELIPVTRRDGRCAHCARVARRAGLRFPRR